MASDEIRQKFLKFFEARGHKIIPSALLVPQDDSSVLFTTAGMQQFKPYYTGDKDSLVDFDSKNTASAQKCVRTSDIDEIGDNTHLTFFEMLGNFSFGDYWKEEAIKWAHEFITQELGLEISYVTVFCGSAGMPRDEESKRIWNSLGITDVREEGMKDVFWGPTGNSGPCGPTTEIYCQNASSQEVEIWNIVFNEFMCNGSREEFLSGQAKLTPLATKGIDTGLGLERLLAIVNKKDSVFETDLFAPIMSEIVQQSAKPNEKAKRIVADHIRTAVFLLADSIIPSNTDRGYVLRRIIRRAVRYADQMQADSEITRKVAHVVIEKYKNIYPELEQNREKIFGELNKEEERFRKTLAQGLKEFEKNKDPFDLYQTFGFPIELTEELAKEKGLAIDRQKFDEQMAKHQNISRSGAEQKFKGGLAGTGEMETKYHTATHLLLASLRQVLDANIVQKGSNITAERLRFDFNWPAKLTGEQIKAVEDLVNAKIGAKIPVEMLELPKDEALKIVTTPSFDLSKYGDTVKIYKIGGSTSSPQAFSAEFCGGPHVANTGDLGHFHITKEEAVATGIRRIKAVLTN